MTKKQTILITGASSGIGKATAKLFQSRGWNVIATMRSPEKETELTQLENVLVTRLDVTDAASINAAITAGVECFQNIDALVNNAAFGVYGPLEAAPMETIRRQFDTNVIGVLHMTKALLPIFRANRKGTIINISSVGGKITFPLGTLYHGTKFAIEGLSEALSFEMAEVGVRVKIVEPGDVLTDFKIEVVNDESITEYQSIIKKLWEGYAPIKAQGSEAHVIAEVIYEAATDRTSQLRYPAGHDAISKIAKRKTESDAEFLQDMRNQFSL